VQFIVVVQWRSRYNFGLIILLSRVDQSSGNGATLADGCSSVFPVNIFFGLLVIKEKEIGH